MRRSAGAIEPIGPNLWRVRVSAGRDPVTGARRRPIKTVSGSRRKAEQELAKMLASTGQEQSSTMTLDDYLTAYWLPHAERLRPKTYAGYKRECELHIAPHLGPQRLDRITPWVLDQWLVSMTQAGIPDPTRRYAQRVLRIALRQAVKWRMLAGDPTVVMEQVETREYEPEVLEPEQAITVLKAFLGHLLEPVVFVALGAGLRRSEILGLVWDDFDETAGTISIERGFHAIGDYQDTKSERSERVLSLPSWAVASLVRWRGRQAEIASKHAWPVTGRTPIITSQKGTPLDPDNCTHRYTSHYRKALPQPFPYVSLKNLRHSHATIALESGTDPVVVSRRLGHAQFATTDKFYLRPSKRADAAAADRFEGMVNLGEDVGPVWPNAQDEAV